MSSATRPQHPDITDAMWQKIDDVIAAHQRRPGALIPVLRLCQEIVGYLPAVLLDHIGLKLNIPASEVLGVVTFYTLFSLTPKGRHTIKICTGTACYVKGIKDVIQRIERDFHVSEGETSADRRFSLQGVRCLGACGLAPVMVVGKDTYGDMKTEKVPAILGRYT